MVIFLCILLALFCCLLRLFKNWLSSSSTSKSSILCYIICFREFYICSRSFSLFYFLSIKVFFDVTSKSCLDFGCLCLPEDFNLLILYAFFIYGGDCLKIFSPLSLNWFDETPIPALIAAWVICFNWEFPSRDVLISWEALTSALPFMSPLYFKLYLNLSCL